MQRSRRSATFRLDCVVSNVSGTSAALRQTAKKWPSPSVPPLRPPTRSLQGRGGAPLLCRRALLGELLLIGGLIARDLGLIGRDIAEPRRVIGIARFVDLVQVELAGV